MTVMLYVAFLAVLNTEAISTDSFLTYSSYTMGGVKMMNACRRDRFIYTFSTCG